MKKINEDNLALIISESIAKHITTENTDYNIEKYFNDNENDSLELDPYHTNFKDDDDSEIRALYGNDEEYAVCCVVVIDYATHDIIEKQHYSGKQYLLL